MWKAGALPGEAEKQTGGETPGTLWAPAQQDPLTWPWCLRPPTLAKALQFKGLCRGGPCPYPHLIWPDPGLAAKSSLSCQHPQ